MNKVIDHLCKNCGKGKGVHKAKTFECPHKGSGKSAGFNGFSTTKFYIPDENKPIYGFTL